MLCLSEDKIMPETDFCQAFSIISYWDVFYKKSMTYEIKASKSFKNRAKKMALSLNFPATRYSGYVQAPILPS